MLLLELGLMVDWLGLPVTSAASQEMMPGSNLNT